MANKAFLVDVEKCTGCKLCQISCKDEHVGAAYAPWSVPQPEIGQFWVDVKAQERGRLPRVRVSYMPTFCQHCADAPCISACGDSAILTRPDGLVWIDPKACTGCGKCEPACPYDVIYFNSELNVAQKCTGCAHRVDEGLAPRCVEACPHDAILYGDVAALSGPGLEDLHPEFGASPRVKWNGLPRPWIAGTIVATGKAEVVEGVAITVTDASSGRVETARSDEYGDFWVRRLESGRTYKVDLSKAGYRSVVRTVTADGDQDLGTVELDAL